MKKINDVLNCTLHWKSKQGFGILQKYKIDFWERAWVLEDENSLISFLRALCHDNESKSRMQQRITLFLNFHTGIFISSLPFLKNDHFPLSLLNDKYLYVQILFLKIQGKTQFKPSSSNSCQFSLFSFSKRDPYWWTYLEGSSRDAEGRNLWTHWWKERVGWIERVAVTYIH